MDTVARILIALGFVLFAGIVTVLLKALSVEGLTVVVVLLVVLTLVTGFNTVRKK